MQVIVYVVKHQSVIKVHNHSIIRVCIRQESLEIG